MKPTSIIFLLISLVIILSGWLVCRNAEAKAEEEEIQLFDSAINADDDSVNTFVFEAGEIYNKIEIVVDDADIFLYGGYPESKMELINFSDGSYRMTTANRNITVDTTIDIMSIIKFWESGFSFRGLRNYLHRTDVSEEASKRIVLYLPSDSDVNIINITLGKGNVYASNFDTSIDVNLNIKEGNAVLSSFRTTSSLVAEIDSGDIYMKDVKTGIFEATIKTEGNITAENYDFGSVNIIGKTTSVSLGLVYDAGDFTMNLSARHGIVDLFGESRGHEYRDEAAAGGTAMITVSSGNIIIKRMPENHIDTNRPDTGAAGETGAAETGSN